MTGAASQPNGRSPLIERLIGDSGETSLVIGAGRSMAERALPALQRRLAEEHGMPVTVELRAVEVDRTSAARAKAGENFAMAIIASPTSSDALTVVVDAQAVAVMVCAMFGGDPEMPTAPIERDFSPVEIDVATLLIEEIAQVLNGSGKRSLELRLPLARTLSGAEARRRVLRDGASVRIDFGISTRADTGTVTVMVPQRVLIALRSGPAGNEADAPTGADWRARFSEEVMRSTVRLEATMPLARLTLGALTDLKPGQVIEIEETARSRALLMARDKALFVCEFGKLGQNYTVRIDRAHDDGQDVIEGLLPG
ncbi:FliM/FliN family flagellar motor switch protein [Mesorhizobium sp. SP-1A]|uniref:FliM/FliN family flagellar motor switch protein n=1 Tax=Mesorhizobium sp. SP-1A TaxID=3077840 RepID=UPI0028F72FE8|nr:FliM/FliN family flagellar motor switch protein [Mesorhizobium sp. SP-1A]